MLKPFGVYLALGLLYQYWVYGDGALTVGTLVHVLFWLPIMLIAGFWYFLFAILFCAGLGAICFVGMNIKKEWDVIHTRNYIDRD